MSRKTYLSLPEESRKIRKAKSNLKDRDGKLEVEQRQQIENYFSIRYLAEEEC